MHNKKYFVRIMVSLIFLIAGLISNNYITLSLLFYLAAYIPVGAEVLIKAVRNLLKGNVLDENFLMGIATLGAFVIKEYPEAVLVMLLYNVGEYLQDKAVDNSKKSIEKIIKMRPENVSVLKNGNYVTMNPEDVLVGDLILVRPGERIPLDGKVNKGNSTIDNSVLTGESLPVFAGEGDEILAGGINTQSNMQLTVIRPYSESAIKKIMDLVENASSNKAQTDKFITKFAHYYTPAVVIIALAIAFTPWIITGIYSYDWVYRSLIFLVISCPCALVISVPLSYFAGIGKASNHGILIKGANYLDALNDLDIIAFDKTGTLTEGSFEVDDIYENEGYSKQGLLHFAAHTEYYSNHPLSKAIVRYYKEDIQHGIISDFKEYPGLGVTARIAGKTIFCGNKRFLNENGIKVNDHVISGKSPVYVAVDGKYSGYIALSDRIKKDVKETFSDLRKLGIKRILLLTGDKGDAAASFSKDTGIDEYESELLPHMKVELVEKLIKTKRKNSYVAFVGDGINDAPVLSLADVGVSMGGLGSDAAMESSDIVLLTDEPSKLIKAIKISRITRRIVWLNITMALGTKLIVLAMGALGFVSMWTAIFADVGVTLLAVINSVRILKMKI